MNTNSKKVIIVHVLKVLYNFTSREYPVTQTQIAEYLNGIDVACDRKTVGRNLKYLIEMGLPVKRAKNKNLGYYYEVAEDKFFVRSGVLNR